MREQEDISVCEEKVFSSIYENEMTPVRNFIYYQNGDLDKAEDIAQESFVTAWKNCKDVIFSKARSYLFTVAKRIMLNQIRNEKVALKFQKQVSNTVEKQTPEYLALESEFKERLEKAISNLPDKQRTVFLQNRIDKMTFGEIAEMEGVSVKAIEKRMATALKSLKEQVQELKIFKV